MRYHPSNGKIYEILDTAYNINLDIQDLDQKIIKLLNKFNKKCSWVFYDFDNGIKDYEIFENELVKLISELENITSDLNKKLSFIKSLPSLTEGL